MDDYTERGLVSMTRRQLLLLGGVVAAGGLHVGSPGAGGPVPTSPVLPASSRRAEVGGEVPLEDFHRDVDGDDYAPALVRALEHTVPLQETVRLTRLYPVRSTVQLPGGSSIAGNGDTTGLLAPADAPLQLLDSSGVSDIRLAHFLLDGGATPSVPEEDQTRGVRLRDTQHVTVDGLTVRNCADWALSFERCSNVTVLAYRHTGGGQGRPGGRDGVHFLDCSTVLLDGATIDSGDDCVGITSEKVGSHGITVRNVTGRSDIGSVVACNEEGGTTFPTTDITISGIRTSGTARNVVRVCTVNEGTTLSGVSISDAAGTSQLHGIHVAGSGTTAAGNVRISGVDVASETQHGLYLAYVQGLQVDGSAQSRAGWFDGFHLYACLDARVRPRSQGSAHWGMHVRGCRGIAIDEPQLIDCGGATFSAGTGGGLRIHESSGVTVAGGAIVGDHSVTHTALSVSDSSDVQVSDSTRLDGLRQRN